MSRFIGTYECKADAKGRAIIPTAIKKQLLATGELFVLKKAVMQPCLELYPMKEWEAIIDKISELNPYDKENDVFIRRFQAGVKVVEIDATGRIQMAKDLIAYAHIDKDIVVNSKINIIEIWDAALYEQSIDTPDEDFAALAQKVMANVYKKPSTDVS